MKQELIEELLNSSAVAAGEDTQEKTTPSLIQEISQVRTYAFPISNTDRSGELAFSLLLTDMLDDSCQLPH